MWYYKTDEIKQHMPAICNGCDGESIRSQIDDMWWFDSDCTNCPDYDDSYGCPEFECNYPPFCDECFVTAVQIRDFSLLISTPSCHTEAAKLKDRRNKDA